MADIITKGQALSTWAFSGSTGATVTLFGPTSPLEQSTSVTPLRIQGFYWRGGAQATISDAAGVILFEGTGATTIWPAGASGNIGLMTNAPLTLTVAASPTDGGGTLIVYGEVL